jgi:DNA-binding transcriptional ArsR family regulator
MPDVLDYTLDADVSADTPERLKALGDPLRMAVLDLVLERAMSVTELAERLGRPRGSVAHHVGVLVDAGLLQVVRTRKVRALEERFYGRTARTIRYPGTPGEVPFLARIAGEADHEAMDADPTGCGFTLRHARIPAEQAQAFNDRLMALALEFSEQPRDGDTEFAMYVGTFKTNRRIAPKAPR